MRHRPLAAIAAIAMIPSVLHVADIRLNLSTSLPAGLYREIPGPVTVGDLALACPPSGPATATARRRGYYASGLRCPGRLGPVVKIVAAAAGDHVVADLSGLVVNGRRIPCTAPLSRDSAGRPLEPATHSDILSADQVWLTASYSPRSFDSRYHGPWPRASLRGRIVPIWTADDPLRHCAPAA